MNLFALAPHLPWFRDMLARLLNAAGRAKDPEVYAALFLEELPDNLDPNTVGELLAAPDWFQKLCQLEPRWNDARLYPWLETVRNYILQALSSDPGAQADVRGSPPAAHGAAPVPQNIREAAPGPKQQRTGEIDRPGRLPSLTGD